MVFWLCVACFAVGILLGIWLASIAHERNEHLPPDERYRR